MLSSLKELQLNMSVHSQLVHQCHKCAVSRSSVLFLDRLSASEATPVSVIPHPVILFCLRASNIVCSPSPPISLLIQPQCAHCASPVQYLTYVRDTFFMDLTMLHFENKVSIYSAVRIYTPANVLILSMLDVYNVLTLI